MVKIDQKGNNKKIFFFTFMLSSAPWEPEQSGSQKNREGSGAGAKNFKIWGAGAEAEPKKFRLPDNPAPNISQIRLSHPKIILVTHFQSL